MRGNKSLPVWVDDTGDEVGEDLAHLLFIASHQHRVFERLLGEFAQLGEVLVQHLDLFDARNRFAFRCAPDRELDRFASGHIFVLYLGPPSGASPSPGFFCPLGTEKIIWPIKC